MFLVLYQINVVFQEVENNIAKAKKLLLFILMTYVYLLHPRKTVKVNARCFSYRERFQGIIIFKAAFNAYIVDDICHK